MLCFEDFAPGHHWQLGSYTFGKEEIIAFAQQFDPQLFHVDEAAAKDSMFGGLVASGWHTSAICMRLVVEGLLSRSSSMGAPGVDQLRWHHPVRPGDTVSLSIYVVETIPSRSKPDRGIVKLNYCLTNQQNEQVLSMIAIGFFRRREPLPPAPESGITPPSL